MADAQTTPPQPTPSPQQPTATGQIDEKQWAMFTHLGLLSNVVMGLAFLGPLVLWLVGREKGSFVDEQGKEALNFGITITIANVIAFVTTFIFIGIVIGLAVFAVWLIFMILAIVASNKGESYRYPISIRFVQ